MGLDITAGSKLRRVADADDEDSGARRMYPNPDFINRADGITDARYEFDGEMVQFRAGSYSGYNAWRRQLASLIGTTPEVVWERKTGPFAELINFSDCEGIIGPKTSKKLAVDFASFQIAVDAHPDEWFRTLYAEWRKAFELASDDGAVNFH